MARQARRRGGDRGGARRPLRRHQRDRAADHRADQRRARAHPLAGPHGHGHRRGEARGRAARHAVLVLGEDLRRRRARGGRARRARERGGAPIVRSRRTRLRSRRSAHAAATAGAPSSGATSRSRAPPPRHICGAAGIPVERAGVAQAAAGTRVPGRLQLIDGEPPTVLDGAHNPARGRGARRVAAGVLLADAPLALVLGVLEDKDAAAMLAALLPRQRARVVHRAAEQPRALARGAAVARAPARL